MGVLGTTMLTKTPTTAAVCGTEARLEIDGDFYAPEAVVRLVGNDGTELDRFTNPDTRHGLHFEACEVARQITAGATRVTADAAGRDPPRSWTRSTTSAPRSASASPASRGPLAGGWG